jgi:hypothetical protein
MGRAARRKAHGHEQKMIDRAPKAAIAPNVHAAFRTMGLWKPE